MLTPIEIQGKVFKSGFGYDKRDVDAYCKEILSNYEILYKENVELADRLSVLNDGIQYYKSIEKTLQKALVLAEKTAEDTRDAANKKAAAIEKGAHVKVDIIVGEAKNELDKIHLQTIELVQQYHKYKIQFQKLAETQVELINSNGFNIDIANIDIVLANGIENLNALSEKNNSIGKENSNSLEDLNSKEAYESTKSNENGVSNGSLTEANNENSSSNLEDSKVADDNISNDDGFDFIDIND